MPTNIYHQEILSTLRAVAKKEPLGFDVATYLGSPSKYFNISTGDSRKITKQWARNHTSLEYSEFLSLLMSLNNGQTFQEKMAVGDLLTFFPTLKKMMSPNELDTLLTTRHGWAEIDVLCQSTFNADDLLTNWPQWKQLLGRFAKSSNISKRRASLVLLTKPVRLSADDRLATLAFSNIETLEKEREILITKAVSWLLRALIKHHAPEVATYIETHKNSLAPIAYRETKTKLETGKKYTRD